ncbi:MAG: thioredoxin family protein [Sulfolobales archaeon]|nr:thioredoxin family protein [Sulfolobales archaeon]MDW8083564.1 thioredoxin family protein [Sulfolobales archaeon]
MFEVSFSPEDIDYLAETLKEMKDQVTLYVFVEKNRRKCRYCDNTIELVKTLSSASARISDPPLLNYIVVEKGVSDDLFEKYKITRIPSVAMIEGYIRYTGMPAGEEIRGLIETIIRLSTRDSGLSEKSTRKISELKSPVYVEVIVTPTCPYCPYAALIANMIAYEAYRAGNRAVVSDIVEAYENPDIADAYNVMSVPVVAVNKRVVFAGLPYEEQLVDVVYEASIRSWVSEQRKKLFERMLKEE